MGILFVHGLPLALQVALPLVLLGWQAFGSERSFGWWLIKTATVVLYLIAVHVAGLWVLLPWYTGLVFLAAVGVVVLWQLPRIRLLPLMPHCPSGMTIAGRGALVVVAMAVLGNAIAARQMPAVQKVDLEFPMSDGTYYVANGGSVELLNAHLMTLAGGRFRAYRGQSYGVDLLKLGPFGMRASGVVPTELARYAIYGDLVSAPCSGQVVKTEDGHPDMTPPQPDRTHMAGNYVLLDCGGAHVLLGHLQPGSVGVHAGERVELNTRIGLVGNSGNSNEPHLHLHAQRPAASGQPPLSGAPLPVRLNGRYLVRNDRIASVPR
jgi:hypothetical protein